MSTAEEDDGRLREAFAALAPEADTVARMQVRVLDGHERRSRSIWREWWSLLRARPLANGALIAAAALILYFTTPLGLVPGLLRQTGAEPQHASIEAPGARPHHFSNTELSRRSRNGAPLHRNSSRIGASPSRTVSAGVPNDPGHRGPWGPAPPLLAPAPLRPCALRPYAPAHQRPCAPAPLRPCAHGQPGNRATGQPGNRATGQPGNRATRQPGNPATRQPGNPATRQPGVLTCRRPDRFRA
jgi:hypothetical protein